MDICCLEDSRRNIVRKNGGWNGVDYVEVLEDEKSLKLYFLGKLPGEFNSDCGADLTRYLKVTGGRRITDVEIVEVQPYPDLHPDRDDYLLVLFNKRGDSSVYTIFLVDETNTDPFYQSVMNIDPRYQSVDFTFLVNNTSDLDCAIPPSFSAKQYIEPEINYLAKDYASFKQLMMDRLAVLMPDWNERHTPDLMITLIEILAYVGDYLSYYQDAVSTEAYLSTARKRISVRRHARLVDYKLHEGCNSRAWMSVEIDPDNSIKLSGLVEERIALTLATDLRGDLQANSDQINSEQLKGYSVGQHEIFEYLPFSSQHPISSFNTYRNKINFYTWGEKQCHLSKGCTSATLADKYLETGRALKSLDVGDVLIFEELISPETGFEANSGNLHRHAVVLTKLSRGEDKLILTDGEPTPIIEIQWAEEDALPFTLWISGTTGAPACEYKENMSVVRGNIFLADSGKTLDLEYLGEVPTVRSQSECEGIDMRGEIQKIPGRFRPFLKQSPLTFAAPLPDSVSLLNSARNFLVQDARDALPCITLFSLPAQLCKHIEFSDISKFIPTAIVDEHGTFLEFKGHLPDCLSGCFAEDRLPAIQWLPRFDLLSSGPDDYHFVVEIDDHGIAQLRFGDGTSGVQPEAGSVFFARYRVGNGARGNTGADAITFVASGGKFQIRNPLPAEGGTDPEPISEAKLYAPGSFRKIIERAITADDYREIAQRNKKLQRADAELVWTGSWYEAEVFVDPLGSEFASSVLLDTIKNDLKRCRRIGHDLSVRAAKYVPIQLELVVHVLPQYQKAHVKSALIDTFSNRSLAGGKRGFFHPDNFSFGDAVEVSEIIAAGMSVQGIEDITVSKLSRMFKADNGALVKGFLAISSHEIALLDNYPNFPERGKLGLTLNGGR